MKGKNKIVEIDAGVFLKNRITEIPQNKVILIL